MQAHIRYIHIDIPNVTLLESLFIQNVNVHLHVVLSFCYSSSRNLNVYDILPLLSGSKVRASFRQHGRDLYFEKNGQDPEKYEIEALTLYHILI